MTSYQNTSACTSGVGQEQTVTCSTANTFQSVTPSTVPVSVPDSTTTSVAACINGTTDGLAAVFLANQPCDAEEACNNFSPGNLTSKTCGTTSITIVRNNGTHTQTWTKQ